MRRALFVLNRGGTLRIPELRQLEFEIFRRVQVVLKQKLHRAFACFASFAHESIMPQNGAAGNEKFSDKKCRAKAAKAAKGFVTFVFSSRPSRDRVILFSRFAPR